MISDHLIQPYQGKLLNLVLDEEQAELLKQESESFPAITLTQRQQCDLEMLLCGALSPLKGFMNEDVYNSVVNESRLPGGVLWPIPFYLDVDETFADKIEIGARIALQTLQ